MNAYFTYGWNDLYPVIQPMIFFLHKGIFYIVLPLLFDIQMASIYLYNASFVQNMFKERIFRHVFANRQSHARTIIFHFDAIHLFWLRGIRSFQFNWQ